MLKKVLLISFFGFFALGAVTFNGCAASSYHTNGFKSAPLAIPDTIPNADVMEVVRQAINATNNFNEQAVANIYTPNAVVADDEPPYSWNGPTAGIQWINAVESAVKSYHINKFKGTIETVTVYQETAGNVYVIVPVSYSGDQRGHANFSARGAFAFVLRQINDKWLIKSQVWMPEKGLSN